MTLKFRALTHLMTNEYTIVMRSIFNAVTPNEPQSISNHLRLNGLFNSPYRLKQKYQHYWPYVIGIHRWSVDFPRRGSVMWKVFSCHDVTILTFSGWFLVLLAPSNNLVAICSAEWCGVWCLGNDTYYMGHGRVVTSSAVCITKKTPCENPDYLITVFKPSFWLADSCVLPANLKLGLKILVRWHGLQCGIFLVLSPECIR